MSQGNINDPFSIVQETDKAVIDVEAQDDGIMGKILV
jgi:pyruvate/2-oxoglutarate dehydrogenase complex dihydrolipoamide acyltransferase (E2) component